MAPEKIISGTTPLPGIEIAAHELTNVLQIIRGYVSFARKNLPEENANRIDLEQALLATDRAAKIAHQLLVTARTEKITTATPSIEKAS